MADLTPYSTLLRESIDDVVTKGDSNSLSDTLSSGLDVITYRYMTTSDSANKFQAELNDEWYILIQAAKNITTHEFRQDLMIRSLMAVQALGPLKRLTAAQNSGDDDDSKANGSQDISITFSDGQTLWSGLPLLSSSLADEFSRRYYQASSYSTEQRENMAGFLGRLLSVGIYDGPALCALSLFRETLETARPLAEADDQTAPPSLQDLLSALSDMCQNAAYGLAILRGNHSPAAQPNVTGLSHLSGPGELALEAGMDESLSWYTHQRWAFWLKRLEAFSCNENEAIRRSAELCLYGMTKSASNIGLL